MKRRVRFSAGSQFFTIAFLVFCVSMTALWFINGKTVNAVTLAVAFGLLVICALCYMPLSVTVTDQALIVRRPLACRTIPIADIESIDLCAPTMGAYRLLGSGGWCGYWGWFREKDLGRYFAYYGKSGDCFLVRLADGSFYMLGCSDPRSVVDEVNRLKTSSRS